MYLCIPGSGLAAAAEGLSRPLFLHGRVAVLTWADPRPHLELLQADDARQVLWIWERRGPALGLDAATQSLLARAVVPPVARARWLVALPSLARLSTADVPRPHIGDVISLLGAWRSPVTGTPAVDAQVLLRDGKAWALPPVGSG